MNLKLGKIMKQNELPTNVLPVFCIASNYYFLNHAVCKLIMQSNTKIMYKLYFVWYFTSGSDFLRVH